MKKAFGFVFAMLISTLLIYIFLLSPSHDESNADELFERKDFRGAIVLYTKALASNKITFSEERILFKLGNAYRLAGEHKRAFDFYFSILRKNDESVYKNRIQAYFRHEAKDLEMETSLNNLVLESISTGELNDASIVDLKLKRDKLYLQLINILTSPKVDQSSYQVLDLYDNYKNIQTKFLNYRRIAFNNVNKALKKKISRKFVTLWMEKIGLDDFSSLSDLYKIQHVALEDWAECFKIEGDPPVDAFFINVSEEVQTNLAIQIPRLYDFHEKAKVFLVFDDSTLEGSSLNKVKALADDVSILQCDNENECTNLIRQLIHRRSLWQSGG